MVGNWGVMMLSEKNKSGSKWKFRPTVLFLFGWTGFSLLTSLSYVYRVHPTGESAPIGYAVIAVVVCMLTPRTSWRLWKRLLYPLATYIGVSVLGILVMTLLYTPLAILGIKESVGAVGNTIAGITFLMLGMRQSKLFRQTGSADCTSRKEIPEVVPVSRPHSDERSFSEMSEWERLQHIQAQMLYEAGCQGAFQIEELIRPLVADGSCRLPEANFRAGCLVHSFALVWTGISLRVPVEVGKPYMDAVIDSLANEIELRFGFEWSREQIEASVGRTWHELISVYGSSGGQKLLHMSNHVLRHYLDDDKIGLDLALGLVVVMESIMTRGQKFFEALAQPV